MQKWTKVMIGGIGLLGVAAAAWFVFLKNGEFQDESVVHFIAELYTVDFAESVELFKEIDREIEEVLQTNDEEEIVTFSSKVIEKMAVDKYGSYLTSGGFDTLIDTGVLTTMFQLAYDNQSDYKIGEVKKLREKKQEGGLEVSYAVEFGQFKKASDEQQASWSTEVTVDVVEEDNEWKVADVAIENDDYLGQ